MSPDELAAFCTRTDLEALGFGRRAVDRIFLDLPVIHLPGHRRPYIRRDELWAYLAEHTYTDDRVRC